MHYATCSSPICLLYNYRDVRKWWAEYLESCGEWEQAMQYYETANDYYSLVRILCFNGQISRAIEVVEESGCRAAAYHLARRLSVECQVSSESGLKLSVLVSLLRSTQAQVCGHK